MSRVIKDDDELARAIEGMKNLTSELDDPLSDLEDDEIRKKVAILNKTANLVQNYSRGRVVQSDPSRAKYYEAMGMDYQTFGGAE